MDGFRSSHRGNQSPPPCRPRLAAYVAIVGIVGISAALILTSGYNFYHVVNNFTIVDNFTMVGKVSKK